MAYACEWHGTVVKSSYNRWLDYDLMVIKIKQHPYQAVFIMKVIQPTVRQALEHTQQANI